MIKTTIGFRGGLAGYCWFTRSNNITSWPAPCLGGVGSHLSCPRGRFGGTR